MSPANPAFSRVMSARILTCEFCDGAVTSDYVLLVQWDHTIPPGQAAWETATGKVHYECQAALTAARMLERRPFRTLGPFK